MNPDALAIADALDRERQRRARARPAARHPVLIKDNIDTADRMKTTAGSLALVGAKPAARRVRRASACARRARSSSARRTSASGRTSARRTRRAAGAGAAARRRTRTSSTAIRAARAPARAPPSRRTSARSPSAPRRTARSCARRRTNGLVGIKPTRRAREPRGHHPDRRTARTRRARWRARCADAAILLGALAGATPRDAATAAGAAGSARPTTRRSSTRTGCRGARIGVARKFFGFHDARRRAHDEALAALKKPGADHRGSRRARDRGEVRRRRAGGPALRVQGRPERLPRGASGRGAPVKYAAGLIAFNEKHTRTGDAVLRPGALPARPRRRGR